MTDLAVIDASCNCPPCRAQSKGFYEVGGRCSTCGFRFRVKNRKGDKPPMSVDCPNCEVSGYSWRTHEEFNDAPSAT